MLAFATSSLWLLASEPAPAPYLAGMVLGFVVGAAGHVVRSTVLILLGIGLILATTVLFSLAYDPSGAR